MKAVVDNDVLIKGACYGILQELIATIPGDTARVGVLGAARFIVPKFIARRKLRKKISAAVKHFEVFLLNHDLVEPSSDEQRLAANLESSAQALAINLDVGESQLVAILIIRSVPLFVSGDKRAIVALEQLLDSNISLEALAGKIRCLEQLVTAMIANSDIATVQSTICEEPEIDKALSICFSCGNREAGTASVAEGLDSYVAALRRGAGRVLST